MKLTELWIDEKIISKDNQKRRRGRNNRAVFTDPKYRAFEDRVRRKAMDQYKGKMIIDEVWVRCIFFFKNRRHCDLTNLPKSLFDALNGVVWKDDRQIKICTLSIHYGSIEGANLEIGIKTEGNCVKKEHQCNDIRKATRDR